MMCRSYTFLPKKHAASFLYLAINAYPSVYHKKAMEISFYFVFVMVFVPKTPAKNVRQFFFLADFIRLFKFDPFRVM